MQLRQTATSHINPFRACRVSFAAFLLSFLIAVPSQAQRANFSLDAGEAADRFGGGTRSTDVVGVLDGEVIFYKSPDRDRGADVVVGGELRFPKDTNNHASEQAIYAGPAFHFGKNLSAGVHIQFRRIVLPPEFGVGQVFNRDHMELIELPPFIQYNFLSSRRAFLRAEGGVEFSPRFHNSPAGAEPFPHPQLEHGYMVRATLGYSFGKWYVKATGQTRYFKFNPNIGNPDQLYNWRSDFVTGGVGITF